MTAPEGAPFDSGRVEALVTLCLASIVSAAANFSPAVILPVRQIAGTGVIPYDCEQVIAAVQTITTGTPEALGLSGASTFPTTASGANQTLYGAQVTLAIVRNSIEKMTGLGQIPPSPTAYLGNLGLVSQDMAVLLAAVTLIAEAQSSATPRTELPSGPQGGLIATVCRLTVLV